MDYIGAFVFAIIWVKVLLKHFPLPEISFIVASFNFLVAAGTIIYFMRKKAIHAWRTLTVVLMCTTVALAYGYTHNRQWSLIMEQRFYEDPIVHVQTTKYQHLVLTQNKKTTDVYT